MENRIKELKKEIEIAKIKDSISKIKELVNSVPENIEEESFLEFSQELFKLSAKIRFVLKVLRGDYEKVKTE
jgi:hypothetical protein